MQMSIVGKIFPDSHSSFLIGENDEENKSDVEQKQIEDKENRWKVSDEGKGLLLSVSVDNLARIRPEK